MEYVGDNTINASGDKFVATGDKFNERLLRPVLSLTPSQQLELVTDLSIGKLNKQRFKKRASAYKARNEMNPQVRRVLVLKTISYNIIIKLPPGAPGVGGHHSARPHRRDKNNFL